MMSLFADAMAGYQPNNVVSRWFLKKWGTKGKVSGCVTPCMNVVTLTSSSDSQLIETTSVALAFPIPALSASAIRIPSKSPAKWAHWLTLWQTSFHIFVIVMQVAALITGWVSETRESSGGGQPRP